MEACDHAGSVARAQRASFQGSRSLAGHVSIAVGAGCPLDLATISLFCTTHGKGGQGRPTNFCFTVAGRFGLLFECAASRRDSRYARVPPVHPVALFTWARLRLSDALRFYWLGAQRASWRCFFFLAACFSLEATCFAWSLCSGSCRGLRVSF